MQRYEFKVVPAPRRAEKARAIKTHEERFAFTLATLMNELGAQGWDYVRADALPCDERSGLTGTKTSYHNILVFRRPLPEVAASLSVTQPAVTQPAAPSVKALGAVQETDEGTTPSLGPAL